MAFAEYADYDGLGLAELVRRGEVSAVELVDAAIERIERRDPVLNAVVFKAFDEARRAARGPLPAGPFRGVPFLVKDLGVEVAGMPMTNGSVFTRDVVPREDSELVRRQRAAGLVILGKTNTPERGITGTTESRLLGPCRNPWDPAHIAGGSSGGSAAAVAAGLVPLAHASDGLGSIRIPAACCGLFGLKVTRERNPGGLDVGGNVLGFGVSHVVTRTVRDSAAMLDATGHPEPAMPFASPSRPRSYLAEVGAPPGRLRIAFSAETPSGRPIDAEVRAALEDTAKLLASLGHDVEERGLGIDYRALYRVQSIASAANAAAAHAESEAQLGRAAREDELEPLTWSGIRAGRKLSGEQVMGALRELRRRTREILRFFETFALFLTPVTGTPPPRIGHIDPVRLEPRELNKRQSLAFPFTPPFNFTGQPAMSVPLAWSSGGLPLGMQLAARYGDEATLIRVAAQLEAARPWLGRKPPVWS